VKSLKFGVVRSRHLQGLLLIVVCLVLLGWLATKGGAAIDLLAAQEFRLRSWQRRWPVPFFLTGFILYFVACFVPGTNGKAFLCGWLFGTWPGVVVINGASMLAAFVEFFIARYSLRSYIASRYAAYLFGINDRLQRDGGGYVFALRVVPVVPFTIVNALLGVTPLRIRTFWWATQLGMLPGNIAFAWFGASLPALNRVREHGWRELVSLPLGASLLLLAALPFAVKRFARWRKKSPTAC
jgi:uncharacterized membrane protein YdjX (TVP38/TMEM64 family)